MKKKKWQFKIHNAVDLTFWKPAIRVLGQEAESKNTNKLTTQKQKGGNKNKRKLVKPFQ